MIRFQQSIIYLIIHLFIYFNHFFIYFNIFSHSKWLEPGRVFFTWTPTWLSWFVAHPSQEIYIWVM